MSEHFVKHSYGNMRHFCHNSRGICFCNMTDEHITEYEILVGGGQRDFDVSIDDSDTVHLICQDETGNILYIKNVGKQWEKYTLLQSKTPSPYQKSFNLVRVGKWLSAIYTIDYKGNKMLAHHILESSDIPDAVDYIEGEFCSARDENGNIYVLYTNSVNSLGWRKYNWSKKQWSEFNPVSIDGRLINPYIFYDEKLHIAGVSENDVVVITEEGKKKIASDGVRPIFVKNGRTLYTMWQNKKDGGVWASMSNDGGLNFMSPSEFMAGKFAPVKLFGLAYTSFEGCRSRHCYGYIRDNTASLYLLGDFLKVSRTPPKPIQPPVQKPEDAELVMLKIQIQSVSESVAKISNRLDILEKEVNGMKNKDIEKDEIEKDEEE